MFHRLLIKPIGMFLYRHIKFHHRQRYQVVERLLPEGGRVLDAGCGEGHFITSLKRQARARYSVTGLDVRVKVAESHRASYVGLVRADVNAMPFRDNAFDLVLNLGVLEHIAREQHPNIVQEIKRVGKRYFILVPTKSFPLDHHFYIPFFQFLPLRMRHWYCRFNKIQDLHQADLPPLGYWRNLIGGQMSREKFFGLTKDYYFFGASGAACASPTSR